MKIAWFCIPAHGHTNPTLGLVKRLTDAGHQVWYFYIGEVLAEDISILLDRSKYSLRRYRLMRPNGSWDYGYLYTVTIPYKDSINTARARLRARI